MSVPHRCATCSMWITGQACCRGGGRHIRLESVHARRRSGSGIDFGRGRATRSRPTLRTWASWPITPDHRGRRAGGGCSARWLVLARLIRLCAGPSVRFAGFDDEPSRRPIPARRFLCGSALRLLRRLRPGLRQPGSITSAASIAPAGGERVAEVDERASVVEVDPVGDPAPGRPFPTPWRAPPGGAVSSPGARRRTAGTV